MANDYINNQVPDATDTPDAGQNFLPESPETPPWGPPSDFPMSPSTPPWGPPSQLPESPETPPWGPPSQLPESPETPPWGPPSVPGGSSRPNWRPIITFPGITIRPNVSGSTVSVRFLHAAVGVGQVNISVNNMVAAPYLMYSNMTEYQPVTGVDLTVTVRSNTTGRIINRTSFAVDNGGIYTIALINAADGVALFLMEDVSCNKSIYNSCIRVANLTNRSPALDVMLTNGRTLFNNVRFLDVTSYRQFNPGTYSITVATSGTCGAYTTNATDSSGRAIQLIPVIIGMVGGNCRRDVLVTSTLEVAQNRVYTLYLIGNAYSNPQIQMILAESYFEY